jgi:hypothetical protein
VCQFPCEVFDRFATVLSAYLHDPAERKRCQDVAVGRKLVIEASDGSRPVLEQVPAMNESQLQEFMKGNPQLLPLDELGLSGPAVVVGRESVLDSGRIDLVLLGNGGELALLEFKTGPQNPDFRECLAQLLDYGSDLWGMTLDEFENRVAQPYFRSSHSPSGSVLPTASLEDVLQAAWGTASDDAVDWRERLQAQLRDGSFHYVAVAQRFTPPVLKTLRYLNASMRASRFSAVELIRFEGAGHSAFEARFVAGAEVASRGPQGTAKTALAGVDDLLTTVTDDDYRHQLQDLFEALATIDGLTVFWGTTGCSLRVQLPGRSPLSIGWVFPPGPPRWMGLEHVTLGWYEDANGLALSSAGQAALNRYRQAFSALPGGLQPKANAIRGVTIPPASLNPNIPAVEQAVRQVVAELIAS